MFNWCSWRHFYVRVLLEGVFVLDGVEVCRGGVQNRELGVTEMTPREVHVHRGLCKPKLYNGLNTTIWVCVCVFVEEDEDEEKEDEGDEEPRRFGGVWIGMYVRVDRRF